jgi:hypothetical protein
MQTFKQTTGERGDRLQEDTVANGVSERLAQLVAVLITTAIVFGFGYLVQLLMSAG